MNYKIIGYTLGVLLIIESTAMLFGLPFSIYHGDSDVAAILISSGITASAGLLLMLILRRANRDVGKREAYAIVSMGWIFMSLFGTLPFILSHTITNFTDAFFETISGFTTTGASILNDIESFPHGILFWRSFTQWLGGMGIIVLSIAILPLIKIGGIQMFSAEVPGPTTDKLSPRIKQTAMRLWLVYLGFTLLEAILLKFGGMSVFDSINHAFTTMATGGYSTKQASIAYFDSPYIHYVIIVFMFLAGTNFALSYFAITGKPAKLFKNEEFIFYIKIVLGTALIIAIGLFWKHGLSAEQSIRDALFQTVSIVTTTGYATADYMKWSPEGLWVLILMLMFIGGMAGSTGGSVKVIRIQMLFRNAYLEFKRLLHPNAVIPVRFNHQAVPAQIVNNILAFVILYIMIFMISVVVMSFMGLGFDTAIGAVAASIGNIGPGIGGVGPVENYALIPAAGKWYLGFLMLIGRLELFTVIIIFSPLYWTK
ncbi:MAG: TrkH family potassium uptake protein [Candidatus Delongbacteria bacterium]|jgi:trk system potassium uptake protein TrkH|nr:TrkH family potassium uptake protein [Candidatus Delongbacteria bacterium]